MNLQCSANLFRKCPLPLAVASFLKLTKPFFHLAMIGFQQRNAVSWGAILGLFTGILLGCLVRLRHLATPKSGGRSLRAAWPSICNAQPQPQVRLSDGAR